MNNHLTELIFVLDRSGSMEHLTDETIGGFNSLITRQRNKEESDAYVTTVLFDDRYELLHDHMPIRDIPRLTGAEYYARGCTALLDAVGRTIDSVGRRLARTAEEDRPGKILFVITTDGYENASREYSKRRIKEMITLQQNTYNWNFLFLGADIDAVGEADSIGIRSAGACMPAATPQGVRTSFQAVGDIADFLRAKRPQTGNREDFERQFDVTCRNAFSQVEAPAFSHVKTSAFPMRRSKAGRTGRASH